MRSLSMKQKGFRGARLCHSYHNFMDNSQVLHEVHVRVAHQQKHSHCDGHSGNYEDQSRRECLGNFVRNFSSND